MPGCHHATLQLDVSSHAAEAGFARPPLTKRQAATTPSGRTTKNAETLQEHARLETLFPGPLVLPDDSLALDPTEPPQSLRSWATDKARNRVTSRRKTIYVVPPPAAAPELAAIGTQWTQPCALKASQKAGPVPVPPTAEHVRAYLEAFYHPLPVKFLPGETRFVPWAEPERKPREPRRARAASPQPQYIGLQLGDGVTRIAARRSPDGAFAGQLRVGDVLDAAAAALPADAYALVVLAHQDLFEDDDDDFCCGRAYGGSRVAVVSSARYHPLLDGRGGGVETEHAWPFSHCREYVRRVCGDGGRGRGRRGMGRGVEEPAEQGAIPSESMAGVVQAGLAASASESADGLSRLWFSRVARTASHEVGHCFCLEHCSYYACAMQGTAGLGEDQRQPPYLCLVCLAKLTRAVRDVESYPDDAAFWTARYETLTRFCAGWQDVAMFAAYRCWLEKRIEVVGRVANV